MKCERCGWVEPKRAKPEVVLQDWPEGLPPPPPPPEQLNFLHPPSHCPCKFKVGDQVFWDCGDGDLPPIRGEFLRVVEMRGPTVILESDGSWLLHEPAKPEIVAIKLDPTSIIDGHRVAVGPEIDYVGDSFQVAAEHLELVNRWPVLI